jgi:hypothetical protein
MTVRWIGCGVMRWSAVGPDRSLRSFAALEKHIEIIALLFKVKILFPVEFEEAGGPAGAALDGLIQLLKDAKVHDLFLEISAVYLLIKQGLIEFFQVGEWELFVKQFEAYRLVSYFSA